jgi:hypothetical protein
MKKFLTLMLCLGSISNPLSGMDLPSGIIEISSPLIITHSNFSIIGNKTTIRIKDNANCPAIIIGNIRGKPVTNILIKDITIDGNKSNQSREFYKYTKKGVINNDGILIQNANHVNIENVTISNCKSGGLVSTLDCDTLSIDHLTSYNNEYDGIACYETTNSTFKNLCLTNNGAAGISLDNHFNDNMFSNVDINNNQTGIFMRNSNNNVFLNIAMKNNKLGAFISHIDKDESTGCSNNIILGKLDKVIINRTTCMGNLIKNNTF